MMDKLSPDVQMKFLEYAIAQEQISRESSSSGYFFSAFFAFIFGAALMRLWVYSKERS